jgi:rhomboid protease GluP
MIITGAVFVLQIFNPLVIDKLGAVPFLMANGEWWRFVTPMLVHAGGFHLLMNLYVLFMIGPAVEQRYGPVRFVIIYVLSGIGGSIASFAFSAPFILGVGASGAILGLIGAFMADLWQRRDQPSARVQMAGIYRWLGYIFGIGIALQILAELGVDFFLIDNYAHAGGLVMGAAVGYGLGVIDRKRVATALPVAMAVVILFAGLAIYRIAELSG